MEFAPDKGEIVEEDDVPLTLVNFQLSHTAPAVIETKGADLGMEALGDLEAEDGDGELPAV